MEDRFKVDPSGYQSGLIDSPNSVGVWQGPNPNIQQQQPPIQPPTGHLIHSSAPPPPSNLHHVHHHPHPPPVNAPRMPMMPPRDLHFPPQHMRPFRPPHHPVFQSPEYRMHDLNKRLSIRTEECDIEWWERFVSEFFDDDASLSISIGLEDGPKRFNIRRILIPRFFRTLFDGGVSDVYFLLKQPKPLAHIPAPTLDCEQTSMVSSFGKPAHIKVCTDGHLSLEYSFDDMMRIKAWHFVIKQFRELIPRSVVAIPNDNPSYLDQLSKNVTRCGLTSAMLNFLRLCEILEPMQELMSRHKTTTFSPRDCLKTILHQRWTKTCSAPIDTRQQQKPRRKRKTPTNNNTPTNPGMNAINMPMAKDPNIIHSPAPTPSKKRSPANQTYCQANQGTTSTAMNNMPGDVMIVGEPSLMGGNTDDEDERYISRIENTQYDPNAAPSSHPTNQYMSATQPMSVGFHAQQNPQNTNLQSLLHNKQPFISNPSLIHPNQMKREQLLFPGSPSQQQQQVSQPLPSMFSNVGPGTPTSAATFSNPTASINGDLSSGPKRISNTPTMNMSTNPSTSASNTSNSPSTPANHNQNPSTPISSSVNAPATPTNTTWNGSTNNNASNNSIAIGEKKQEPHTPPATPQQQQQQQQQQQTIATVS